MVAGARFSRIRGAPFFHSDVKLRAGAQALGKTWVSGGRAPAC